MTLTRFFIARFAQAFGIVRRTQRMNEAANELHLLREAEAFLGSAVWERTEDIERLSVEYWNLRKILRERTAIHTKLVDCEARLEAAHQERSSLLSINVEQDPELIELRDTILEDLEEKSRERDEVVAKARDVRRVYDGLKMKLEVLASEGATAEQQRAEMDRVRFRLISLKEEFVALKEERLRVGREIEEGDQKIDEIDSKLDLHRKERREKASESFQVISDVNRELSTLRAEDGVLDTRIRQLHGEIGRFVSRNAHNDSRCAAAVKSHRGLTDVMRALRRSIALNHRLSGQH